METAEEMNETKSKILLTIFVVVIISTSIVIVAMRIINPPTEHLEVVGLEPTKNGGFNASIVTLKWVGSSTELVIRSYSNLIGDAHWNQTVSYGENFDITILTLYSWVEIRYHNSAVVLHHDGSMNEIERY
jgi:hypothetical protein